MLQSHLFKTLKKFLTLKKGSGFPNGEMRGEFLWASALGLFASDDSLSFFMSTLHFRPLPLDMSAFRPTNQTSASSLSLHI